MRKFIQIIIALAFTAPLLADKNDDRAARQQERQENRQEGNRGGGRQGQGQGKGQGKGQGRGQGRGQGQNQNQNRKGGQGRVKDGASRTPSLSREGGRGGKGNGQGQRWQGNRGEGGNKGGNKQVSPGEVGQQIKQQANKWRGKGKKEDFKKAIGDKRKHNRDVSKNARKNFEKRHRYDKGWDNKYGYNKRFHDRPRWGDRDRKWWRRNNWNYLAGWLPYGWGSNAPIYYDSGQTFVEITNYQPADDYPETPIANSEAYDEWLPLGQFVAGKDASQAQYSNLYVELAVNKAGEISGTYYNATTDTSQPLVGVIDGPSQQAAWKLSEKPDSPLMVTAAYNLTQDVVNITVHFPTGAEQEWVLVRLDGEDEA